MGSGHFLALLDSGLVYAWGDNQLGQLGVGKSVHRCETPMLVSSLLNKRIVMVAIERAFRSDRHLFDALARVGRVGRCLCVGRQSKRRVRSELALLRLHARCLLPGLHTHRSRIAFLRLCPQAKRCLRLRTQSRGPMRCVRRRDPPLPATSRRLPLLSGSRPGVLRRWLLAPTSKGSLRLHVGLWELWRTGDPRSVRFEQSARSRQSSLNLASPHTNLPQLLPAPRRNRGNHRLRGA